MHLTELYFIYISTGSPSYVNIIDGSECTVSNTHHLRVFIFHCYIFNSELSIWRTHHGHGRGN